MAADSSAAGPGRPARLAHARMPAPATARRGPRVPALSRATGRRVSRGASAGDVRVHSRPPWPRGPRVDFAYESAPRAAEAMLWAGRPGDALRETRRALALFKAPDLTILSGRLLAAGMRACADLAGQARARRDQSAADGRRGRRRRPGRLGRADGRRPVHRPPVPWPPSRPSALPGTPSGPGWPGPATPAPGTARPKPGRT